MQQGEVKSGFLIGLSTGLIAWSCCISGVVLAFLGLATAATFFADIQMKYHWWLVGLAFLFMDGAIYYFLKHYHGACSIPVIRHNYAQLLFIVLIAVFAYLILQAILPTFEHLSGLMMPMM